MRYKTVFWDWNGTLFDDVEGSRGAINKMLASRGRAPIDLYEFRDSVCSPIIGFYRRQFDLEKEDFDLLAKEYHALYGEAAGSCGLADGARELLLRLSGAGVAQAIASASRTSEIEGYIASFGIGDCFCAILGSDDMYAGDKFERVLRYVTDSGITPSDCIFIGDAPGDLSVASRLGSDCILASWGHKNRDSLTGLGCPVADDIDEIVRILFQNG